MQDQPEPPSVIRQENPAQPITVVQHPPDPLHMYTLREDQIDQLASPTGAFSLGICTACLGFCLAFIIVLQTVENLNSNEHGGFLGAAIATGGLFIFFAYFAVRDFIRVRVAKNRIVKGQIDS